MTLSAHKPGLKRQLAGIATATTGLGLMATAAQADPQVEVLHWWTSGGEAEAVKELKQAFEEAGGTWKDSPIAGGGGDAAMTALRSRVVSGNPPSAVQLKGPNIYQWAKIDALAKLNGVAKKNNWKELLPPVLNDVVTYKGDYVAAPVNIHRVDWLWANPDVLQEVDGEMPKTWSAFNKLAKKLEAAGITPLAHGGQPWQTATLFEVVALGLGGPDFYRNALVKLNDKALTSDTMVAVFEQMRTLRGFVDPNFPGRSWDKATAMVMNGDAAFQIMGDWAKGEFVNADMKAGEDYLCASAPGSGYILNSDSFAFFKVSGEDRQKGQKLFARLVLDKDFQRAFNKAKGSIPARMDMSLDNFDRCAQRSKKQLEAATDNGSMVPSMAHEMAVSRSVRGAILDVVAKHFNSDMSAQRATQELAAAVKMAR